MSETADKRLLIVGAGGFGREVLSWAEDIPRESRAWEVGGFLDKNAEALAGFDTRHRVIGDPEVYQRTDGDVLVCALGDPGAKLALMGSLKSRGCRFLTLIHPSAIVGQRSVIGEGSVLCPRVTITVDATIGSFVTLNVGASVGHDAVVGSCSTLSAFCDVTGKASLGTGVFMGSHASVLPGVSVGEFARVGAGSVVLRRVKPRTTVMGVPAQVVFERSH